MATLADTPRTQEITVASATAGPFDITLRLFSDDLRVTVNGVETTAYSLTLALADGFEDDATITFDAPLAINDVIVIDPVLPPARGASYSPTEPNLTKKLNIELARIWSVLQQFARDFNRSIKIPSNAAQSKEVAAPTAANQVFASNSDNTGFVFGPATLDDVANAQANATAAAASAQEAEGSAAAAATFDPANFQPVDAGLTSISALTVVANNMIYATGPDTYAVADLTAAGRALLDDADAAAQRTTLGLGGLATLDILDQDDFASNSATRPPSQQSTKAYIDNVRGQYLHVRDQKTAGTAAGNSTNTTNHTRTLNTVVANSITGASLSTNQVTLPTGTYEIFGRAPSFEGREHRLRLRNVTDSTDAIIGPSQSSGSTSGGSTDGVVRGQITIASAKAFSLIHYFKEGETNGLGRPVDDGLVEIYAELFVRKIA